MKKLLSLILALVILTSVAVVFPSTASAAEATFNEGDTLYMKVISPQEWSSNNPIMYANFTQYSRADNGGVSVIIADADKSQYDPRTGITYDVEQDVYKYTVTKEDAGKTAMRFWRGNDVKLWNCSIVLTAEDYANGYNMVTIDGGSNWDDSGDKLRYYALNVSPKLNLSSNTGDIGDTITVTVELDEIENVNYAYEIRMRNEVVSNEKSYSFTATENGTYSFTVNVTATDSNGEILGIGSSSASVTIGVPVVTGAISSGLYAHACSDSKETEAWVKWYNKNNVRHFLMPTSTDANTIEIYNNYSTDAVINGVTIAPQTVGVINYETGKEYTVTANNKTYTAKFMISSAEAAVFVNNPSDFDGKSLWDYLTADKENEAKASAATLDDEGNLDSTPIKKIKGRGNTSWQAEKKGFNITYDSAISLDGMKNCKKFSIISNFQDPALSRNRILYDLADEVGVPYASDSRFTEIYINGEYIGNYMMCEKVDVGKNTLIPEVDEEDYLNYVSGEQADFSFVCEIDNAPSADDFNITMGNKNRVTMKAPELESADSNYNAVKNYIKSKYDTMWSKITSNAKDVNDYIDIESLAQVYLINELGKNWDSGAGSFYFVYKPDESGHYKFFASPVWDYDNSLGNANGVSDDLRNLGITDYTLPTGWFAKLKNGYSGPNFLTDSIKNCDALNEIIPTVWFEQFVPAIENKLNGTGLDNTELYSQDVYYSYLKDSATLNYLRWDMVTDTGWIANHTSLKKSSATYTYNEHGQVIDMTYNQDARSTSYTKYDFKAEFDYMVDWTNSRAAWLSDQYFDSYTPSEIIPTEPPTEEPTEIPTEPVLPDKEPELDLTNAIAAWQFDPTGKVEEEKLTEYGTGDEGYKATYGNGKMIGTVNGVDMRSLEWSVAEYGTNGVNMVPIMAAGSKNLWCEHPYIQFEISTKDYTDIHFTAYMAGSKKCPASWQVQYSTDGTTFTNVEGAVATITMDKRKLMTAYLNDVALPSAIDNLDSVIIRLTPTSNVTVSSSTTDVDPSGGELAINNILISGTKSQTPVEYKKGDVDLDDEVTVLDATAIQKHCANLLTLSEQSMKNGDVTDDETLDVLDATTIQKFLAEIIDTL